MRNLMRAVLASGTLLLAVAASAQAATTIGETFTPTIGCGGFTALQTTSPGDEYIAPSAGVITAWSFEASASPPPEIKLKVARRADGGRFTILGESPVKAPAPAALNTYTDVRVPVRAGDLIGLRIENPGGDCTRSAAGYVFDSTTTDPPPGQTMTFEGQFADLQLDLAARLEPDADNDGFGDETQDQCPTSAATQGDCDPPETTITKGAPNKTAESKVKFKFRSDEAGSTFQCKIDRKPWKTCTSPKTVKRLDEGRHKFKVRATDAAGNPDPTPDKDRFRVVD